MSDKPLVSVVIASYNMGRFLPLSIASAREQSYGTVEILVIDDGSTDDTEQVVQAFLCDDRVRYVRQENAGQASSKNRGIREARGEFIAFLDADDIWERTKLDKQISLFLASEAVGVVFCRYVEIDETGTHRREDRSAFYRGKVSGRLLVYNFIGFSTSVVKRECFENLGCFKEDLGMGIDYEFWLRLSTRYEFDFVDEVLVGYRIWAGQMSKNVTRRYLNGIQTMKSFLRTYPGVVEERVRREAWAYTYSGYGDCLRMMKAGSKAAFREYLRALTYKPTYVRAWKGILKAVFGL